jgi:glutathione S-transferase
MALPVLVGEYFSPWTEKARWALDHHGVAHDYSEHVPLLGEPLLRLRARGVRGRVSVPLLLTEAGPIPDSFAIARHAERVGSGEPLIPTYGADTITTWNERSERALAAARARYLDRVLASRDAKVEMQPSFLPLAIRRLSVPITDTAIRFLRGKYNVDAGSAALHEATLVAELEGLREGLAAGGGAHLVGRGLTYADVAMAVTLQFVAPVEDTFLPLGPATRASCHDEALAARFADLVAWRDRLYTRFRGVRRA